MGACQRLFRASFLRQRASRRRQADLGAAFAPAGKNDPFLRTLAWVFRGFARKIQASACSDQDDGSGSALAHRARRFTGREFVEASPVI
jgi:hypothetical protein